MMNDAELTILSLVAEGPRYGYEIQQIIDERGLREWLTIGFSSIYYVLNKLERQNMVSGRFQADGRGPAKKLYEVTEAGRGILQTAVAELLRQPRTLGSGFELGLSNLKALKPRQVYQVLRHHQLDLKQSLTMIQHSWERHQKDKSDGDHIRALYTHSIAVMQAELNWLESFLEDWRTRYPGVERDDKKGDDAIDVNSAVTRVSSRTTSGDPAKMIQRLKRLNRPPEG
jgi:DNA-binding PadR family transcriptional regulator